MEKYLDQTLSADVRAKDLLDKMSIDEKMAQVVGCFPMPWMKAEDFEEKYPYGAGTVAVLLLSEGRSASEFSALQRQWQDRMMALSPHRIPAFFHVEGLCGVMISGAAALPSGVARGASWNPELEEKLGKLTGGQAAAMGCTQIFGPVLDINRDARFGRQGESYSEDATLTSALGAAYLKGLESIPGNFATAKHFAGFHASSSGIHGADCMIPDRLLREVYVKPFQAAVTQANLSGVMPCYNTINGEPAAASKTLLDTLLRDEMDFKGYTVSDYSAVQEIYTRQHVGDSLSHAGAMALAAGMDMELPDKCCYNEELKQMCEADAALMARLDQAVLRILTVKFKKGLFEHPYGNADVSEIVQNGKEQSELLLQAAHEAIVLLKNENQLLPLEQKTMKIALIGHHASSVRAFYGGYSAVSVTEMALGMSNTMAGVDSSDNASDDEFISGTWIKREHPLAEKIARERIPYPQSLCDELTARLPMCKIEYAYGYSYAGNDRSHYAQALEIIKDADLVIMTVGGKYGTGSTASTGEGIDSSSIGLPECQEQFIVQAAQYHKPMVAIHFDGRPVSSDGLDMYADAVIEAWSLGDCGARAIVDVLLGEYNPGGKLPVTVARHAGQLPLYYGHPNGSSYHQGAQGAFNGYAQDTHKPRYYFGFGLSYTTFTYKNLQVKQKELSGSQTLELCVDITNSGTCDGDEIVQVYIRDEKASIVRPVMELAGFKRVHLCAGETKTVTFTVDISQLAFLDGQMRWKVESGAMTVYVGASADDLRLKEHFVITKDMFVDGSRRAFYTIGTEMSDAGHLK